MNTQPSPKSLDTQILETEIIKALRMIYDPEIPVNIYDLGLIYKLTVSEIGDVKLEMTLTTPACPVAQSFPGRVEAEVRAVEGVNDVVVELVWDPPWTQDNMTEAARLQLGLI
jgi:FeS assembly SUF system protein